MLRLKILKITNIPDITNLATNGSLNAQINEVKSQIPSITKLATTAALTVVENKIPNVSNLMLVTQKYNEIEKKVTDHDDNSKYITTPEFNKLAPENFSTRLKEANLESKSDIAASVKKVDFDDKIKNVNKKVTSNKAKHVLVQNELNELSKKVKLLSTKDYSSFLSRIYFASNDGSQNKFVYQPTLDTLELKKKTKVLIMFLVGNQMDHIILNLSHYILLSCMT